MRGGMLCSRHKTEMKCKHEEIFKTVLNEKKQEEINTSRDIVHAININLRCIAK